MHHTLPSATWHGVCQIKGDRLPQEMAVVVTCRHRVGNVTFVYDPLLAATLTLTRRLHVCPTSCRTRRSSRICYGKSLGTNGLIQAMFSVKVELDCPRSTNGNNPQCILPYRAGQCQSFTCFTQIMTGSKEETGREMRVARMVNRDKSVYRRLI